MRPRVTSLIAFMCVAILGGYVPAAVSAVQMPRPVAPLPDASAAAASPAGATERISAMIELGSPAAILLGEPKAVVAQRMRNQAAQAALDHALRELGAQVLFRVTLAYNGIAVSLPARHLAALRRLPGVAAVHILAPKQRLDAEAVTYVGAPDVWSSPESETQGATGRGFRIGVIDSGIDYTHANFGGPGTPQAYTQNDRTIVEPNSFPTNKVIGGYDFAGDAYDASGTFGSVAPAPDPDPLDCKGHGTQVASIAAGFGVTANGKTYRGPYSSKLDLSTFRIGPGVAPEASLYALKVFGCQGTTALLPLAIERALDPDSNGDPSDHLDVVSISFGSPFSGDADPDAVAVNNAVQAGIVVVAAAGNTGNTFYAINSPASAQRAVAVGASVDAARATAMTPADSLYELTARGPERDNRALKPDMVAPGVAIRTAAVGSGADTATGSGSSMAAAQVAGAAALLRQLRPQWGPEQIKAALVNTAASVQAADGTSYPPSLSGAGRLDIKPFAKLDMVAYAADADGAVGLNYGAPWLSQPWQAQRMVVVENNSDVVRTVAISATITAHEPGVTLTLPPGPFDMPPRSQVTLPVTLTIDPAALDFSPDAATPARQNGFARYYMAEFGGYVQFISTRSNSPRVRFVHAAQAGRVDFYLDSQLLAESISATEISQYRPTRFGNRTVRVLRAGDPPNATPLATLPVDLLLKQDYTIVFGGAKKTYGIVLVADRPEAMPAADQALIHVVNANLPGPHNDSGPLDVYLDGAPLVPALAVGATSSFLPLTPGSHTVAFYRAGAEPVQRNLVALEQFTANGGDVVLIGAGQAGSTAEQRSFLARVEPRPAPNIFLRVPFQVFPKSASAARVANTSITVSPWTTTFAVGLHNTGARNAPLDATLMSPQVPLASAFELGAASPPRVDGGPDLLPADVQFLGVTSNLPVTQNIATADLFFGIASYGPWSTPNEVRFLIYIDTNLDGIDDYVLCNTSLGAVPLNGPESPEWPDIPGDANRPDDVFVSSLYQILPDGRRQVISFSYWNTFSDPLGQPAFDGAPYNTAVLFQTASAQFLGLHAGQTVFRYRLETRSRFADHFGRVVDRVPETGWLEYDMAHPALTPINVLDVQSIIMKPASIPAGVTRLPPDSVTQLAVMRPALPVFIDVAGGEVRGFIDPNVLAARGGQNLLVLHHHNAPPSQVEIVNVHSDFPVPGNPPTATRVFLPQLAHD